ncbi:hypothetical protein AB0442_38380 [Kitasatospora sp. NPDC085895]|uniref:hypothetical protein n=1 Tax=Kitasatospora sp. NPDC085895 TaxID=3155057 RepID=UPI00344F8BDB
MPDSFAGILRAQLANRSAQSQHQADRGGSEPSPDAEVGPLDPGELDAKAGRAALAAAKVVLLQTLDWTTAEANLGVKSAVGGDQSLTDSEPLSSCLGRVKRLVSGVLVTRQGPSSLPW